MTAWCTCGLKERGAALVVTLLITALVGGLGGALLLVTTVETAIEANHRQSHAVRQGAEAGLACAVAGLRATPDWSQALAAVAPAIPPCLGPATIPPSWPGGGSVDPPVLTGALQMAANARYGTAPDTPRWALWLDGAAPGAGASGPVVLIWIADDAEDGDGDPTADANDVVWVRAEAFGYGAARSAVEALVRRLPGDEGQTAVIGWRATR